VTQTPAPLISVVMAAYNGAGLIEDTIASVLAQDLPDFEIVVVDDASTDDTLARLHALTDPRIRIMALPANGGPVVARNTAFAAARGRYIVGLDQDDLCHPDRFSTQVAWLDAHPDTVLVASAVNLLRSGTIRPPRAPVRTTPASIAWRMQFGNPLVWSSVMFRADAARRLDVFERTDRIYAEDFDFYTRIARIGTLARIDRPLLTYRIHPGGASRRFTKAMDQSASAVLADMHRARLGADADEAARLMLVHFTGGVAVPDGATLDRLGQMLSQVHGAFCAAHLLTPVDRALIIAEYARMWWRLADASVRAGTVSPGDAQRTCPQGLRARHPSRRRALGSAAIGSARAALSRWKALAGASDA
jgi:hypothetical protein